MSIKNLKRSFKKKNLKELDKYSRMDIVYDAIPELCEKITEPKKGQKVKEILGNIGEDSLVDLLINPKFIKTVKSIVKSEDYSTDVGFAMVINAVISNYYEELDDETIEELTILITKILKELTKKVAKKTDISKEVVQEFLVILPSIDVLSRPNIISMYTDRMLFKAYSMAKDDTFELNEKQLKKLFTVIAGKDYLVNIATGILLQRKEMITNFTENQLKMWNVATNFALNLLEKSDKSEIERSIKYYNKIVTKFPGARRIELSTLLEEDYPKIIKVVSKLNKLNKKEDK